MPDAVPARADARPATQAASRKAGQATHRREPGFAAVLTRTDRRRPG